MLPAQKCLETGNFACRWIEHRLVRKVEIPPMDSETQVCLQGKARNRDFVHLGVEDRVVTMTRAFRLIHGDIGITDQVVGRRVPAERLRDSDTDGRLMTVTSYAS
jgi:hypothetical protein